MPRCRRAWWESVSSGAFHYSCPPFSSSQFPFFLLSIPSSALLLSQRAMDLLEGITKKAWCYHAYILMDTMQEGEGRRWEQERRNEEVNAWRGGDKDMWEINTWSSTHEWKQKRRGGERVIHFLYCTCNKTYNYVLRMLCSFTGVE